jgi:hypothetical protein
VLTWRRTSVICRPPDEKQDTGEIVDVEPEEAAWNLEISRSFLISILFGLRPGEAKKCAQRKTERRWQADDMKALCSAGVQGLRKSSFTYPANLSLFQGFGFGCDFFKA